ncbi:hypothetical protein FYK55_27345 [Roseiconus nitratireducens]|uniref:Uncharacterized protein n=1 Tax=Roseiconus nitratireducens TaxID=2605748 RepID=A0A5M6D0D4_9BACT|nr:hypothetical protein [Roseiconus nitratireducens]KAA5538605.1 hypothetical protein FYK55_27345 [Roseiconus nitratireducens]
MTANTQNTLADILPIQNDYYILSNGDTYARFGHGGTNGLLVFDTMEKASDFCSTVACGVPEFQPVKVEAERLLMLIEEVGAVCVTDGLNVGVGVLSSRH